MNEYLGGKVFEHLGIATAKMTPLNVSPSFLVNNPGFQLLSHHQRVPLHAGVYLGSRYSVDPEKVSIFDFLPAPLMDKVTNLSDFLGALVADQWLCNHDHRQFVFFSSCWLPKGPARGFHALAIDHGMCLGGGTWKLFDSPLTGIYCQPALYRSVTSVYGFEPWLKRLSSIGEEQFNGWIDAMPGEWLIGERLGLQNLVARLLRRKRRIPELVQAALNALPSSSNLEAPRHNTYLETTLHARS